MLLSCMTIVCRYIGLMARPTEKVPSFGRETRYRGVTFKSQCEARWAALIDILGGEWEYEPNGEGTFPDFRVTGIPMPGGSADPWWLEVKGGVDGESDFVADVRYEVTGQVEGVRDKEIHVSRQWAFHPDAIKARECAITWKGPIAIGCSDGVLMVPRRKEDDLPLAHPAGWIERQLRGETSYDWPRTMVMVTGKGKH